MATVMGILIFAFGIWGIQDIFRGFGRSTLAKVGSTEISQDLFASSITIACSRSAGSSAVR